MKTILTGLLLVVLTSCSHQPLKSQATAHSNDQFDFPIIDAHAHFHSKELNNYNQPASQILMEYQDAGVSGAVVHLSESENFKVEVNRSGKIKWKTCMGIHPGDLVEKVEKGIRAGRFQCIKIYLGYVPKWATDSFYRPFYRLAERYKLPVVFHTGDTYDKNAKVKYADPLQIDEVAVEYPGVNFVIAHLGNPWFQSAAEVIYKNDNVFADVSALLLGDVSEETPENLEELVIKPIKWIYAYVNNPKKFMFGSDWPLVKVKPYLELMKLTIPEKDWKGFFGGNAQRVFRFEEKNN